MSRLPSGELLQQLVANSLAGVGGCRFSSCCFQLCALLSTTIPMQPLVIVEHDQPYPLFPPDNSRSNMPYDVLATHVESYWLSKKDTAAGVPTYCTSNRPHKRGATTEDPEISCNMHMHISQKLSSYLRKQTPVSPWLTFSRSRRWTLDRSRDVL